MLKKNSIRPYSKTAAEITYCEEAPAKACGKWKSRIYYMDALSSLWLAAGFYPI
jgi:hypothetical protein